MASDLTIFVSVYGDRHAWFLYSFINSYVENFKNADLVVGHQGVNSEQLEFLRSISEKVSFIEYNLPADERNSHNERASRNIDFRYQFLQSAEENQTILFVDADMVFYKSPEMFIKNLGTNFDLVLTRKMGKFPLNAAVIIAKKNSRTLEAFARYRNETKRILSDKAGIRQASSKFGSPDQYALVKILDIEERIMDSQECCTAGKDLLLRLMFIPCDILNQTESVDIVGTSTLLVHLKTGWHPIVLDGKRFNKLRPKKEGSQIFSLWLYHRNEGLKKSAIGFLQLDSIDENFEFSLGSNYRSGGIFVSEMAIAQYLVQKLDCNFVIESGRYEGYSTEILAKNFPEKTIYSFELRQNQVQKELDQQFKNYSNLTLLYGNSSIAIPRLCKEIAQSNPDQGIAVLLDGPKGIRAIHLARKVIRSNKNVKLIMIHDMRKTNLGKPSIARYVADLCFARVLFTDDLTLPHWIKTLDGPVFNYNSVVNNWQPFQKDFERTSSYGPTLAIIFPSIWDGLRNSLYKKILLESIPYSRLQSILSRVLLRRAF